MSHNSFKPWTRSMSRQYLARLRAAVPPFDGMTPEQRSAKRLLDSISGVKPTISWLDRTYRGQHEYTMPGTTLPAYRYTFITKTGQHGTKEAARLFEQAARSSGLVTRSSTHLTRSSAGHLYWKVEAYFPVHSFR